MVGSGVPMVLLVQSVTIVCSCPSSSCSFILFKVFLFAVGFLFVLYLVVGSLLFCLALLCHRNPENLLYY